MTPLDKVNVVLGRRTGVPGADDLLDGLARRFLKTIDPMVRSRSCDD